MSLNEQINKGANGSDHVYIIGFEVYYTNRLALMINSCTVWNKAFFFIG